jgi:hypothetical protein
MEKNNMMIKTKQLIMKQYYKKEETDAFIRELKKSGFMTHETSTILRCLFVSTSTETTANFTEYKFTH